MKRICTMCAALLMMGAVAFPAWAQQAGMRQTNSTPAQTGRFGNPSIFAMNYQNYFFGVIAKIEPHALVLDKTKVGVPQTIHLMRKTKYIRNKKKSSLSKLKVGDMVYIDLKTAKKSGDMYALKVISGMSATVAP